MQCPHVRTDLPACAVTGAGREFLNEARLPGDQLCSALCQAASSVLGLDCEKGSTKEVSRSWGWAGRRPQALGTAGLKH